MSTATADSPTVNTLAIKSLEEILAGDSDLAALPQVVMRVIDLTADPKATPADLERVIGMDQALAARILTLANSSYYGLPRRISSLREAVVFLGFKTLRNMALTITTFNLFLGRSDSESLVRRAIWRHSVDTAQCAKAVTSLLSPAMREEVGTDQVYTCALLHDIGKMALDRSQHSVFAAIVAMANAKSVRYSAIEAHALPFHHGEIGAALATRWNLPPMLCEAIGFHHTPRAAELNPKLTATVCLANEIAHFLQDIPQEKDFEVLQDACAEAVIPLRVSETGLHGMVRACREELDKGLSGLAF
ncbi:MAG: HDOD domain-containing protein [Janthinobacterium lividum]